MNQCTNYIIRRLFVTPFILLSYFSFAQNVPFIKIHGPNALQTETEQINKINIPTAYCTPGSSNCSTNNHISRVAIGTLDNSTACSTNGYGDHTGLPAPEIHGGKLSTLTITKASSTSGDVAAWIDLNHNSSFEATEYFFISNSSNLVVSAAIFIPSSTAGGSTRMRVRRRVSGTLTANDFCLFISSGETEDYTINIIPAKVVITPVPLPKTDTLYNPSITLKANIKQTDIGINNTDSLSPRLWARRAGSTAWKQFKGSLVTGTVTNGNWEFSIVHDSLGIRHNDCDSVQYYFVAQDLNDPFNMGFSPEVGAAHTNVKVQVTPPNTLYGYRLKSRLKDVIYVNSSGCGFKSLTNNGGLFEKINSEGLSGNLTVMIESNLSEAGTHALNGPGMNGYSLIIRPYEAVTYNINMAPTNTQMIRLNGVKNVMIDGSFNGNGRWLQFRTLQPNYHLDSLSNIRIYNSSDSVLIRNCVFENQPYGSLYFGESSIWIAGGTNRHIAIYDNLFRHQTLTSVWPSRHIVSTGSNDSVIVRRNEITNNSEHAIKVVSGNNWIIDSNHFYRSAQMGPYGGNYTSIWVAGGGHKIRNNYVGGSTTAVGGAPMSFLNNPASGIYGIDVQSTPAADSVIIEYNHIDNIDISTNTIMSYANGFTGINIFNNRAAIRNNTIGSSAGNNYSIVIAAHNFSGIKTFGAQGVLIERNTIRNISSGITNGLVNLNIEMAGINASVGSAGRNIIKENLVARLRNNFSTNGSNSTQVTGTIGISAGGASYIEHNTVHDLVASEYKLSGIALYNATQGLPSLVHRNRIYNLVNNSSFVSIPADDWYHGAINGIVIENVSVLLDVKNNQVSLNNNNITSPVTIRGILAYSSFGTALPFRVLNNTVYIGGTANNHGGSAALAILSKHIDSLHNNLLFNERTGSDMGHFAVRIFSGSTASLMAGTKANFNYYVVRDSSVFAQYGAWGPVMKWTEWKSTFSIDDSSRVSFPPIVLSSQLFFDKDNGNLNINAAQSLAWLLNNRGRAIFDVADDLDSVNARSTIPGQFTDIGADEFSSFVIPSTAICVNGNTSFTSNIASGSYQWQVNTGSGFTNISNNSNYAGATTQTLQINNVPLSWDGYTFRSVSGTATSDTFTLYVLQSVNAAVTITGPALVCANSNVTFTATPVNGGSNPQYQWKINGINAGSNSPVFQTSALAQNDQVSVLMTSSFSCATTAQSNIITISIQNGSVTANAGNDVSICAGQSATLGTPSIAGNSYSWSPPGGLSAANVAQPVASPPVTTSYILTVTSLQGCTARDTVVVMVMSIPTPVITQNGNVLTSSATTGNQWYKDGVAINGATTASYTATSGGSYSVRVTAGGCTSNFSNIIVISFTSVGVDPVDAGIRIGPNPVMDVLKIHSANGLQGTTLIVTDVNGRVVIQRSWLSGQEVLIPMAGLAPGSYFVKLHNTRSGKEVNKVVVKM